MQSLDEDSLARLLARLERIASLRIVVVGDLILDAYQQGPVERLSPEAPVPIVRVDRVRTALGGAANVARAVRALGAECALVAACGDDPEGERVIELLGEAGLPTNSILRTPTRPTSHKTRVIAGTQQLVRIDREETGRFADGEIAALLGFALECGAGCDSVILQDYDKGIFAEGFASALIRGLREQRDGPARPLVVADPKNAFERFRGADLMKPNWTEACAALAQIEGSAAGEGPAARALLEKLRASFGVGEWVVTRGAEGMWAGDGAGVVAEVPTRAVDVFDVQGAGDTCVAALALCRAAGASLVEACIVANAAAGVAVSKAGTAVVTQEELRAELIDRSRTNE